MLLEKKQELEQGLTEATAALQNLVNELEKVEGYKQQLIQAVHQQREKVAVWQGKVELITELVQVVTEGKE